MPRCGTAVIVSSHQRLDTEDGVLEGLLLLLLRRRLSVVEGGRRRQLDPRPGRHTGHQRRVRRRPLTDRSATVGGTGRWLRIVTPRVYGRDAHPPERYCRRDRPTAQDRVTPRVYGRGPLTHRSATVGGTGRRLRIESHHGSMDGTLTHRSATVGGTGRQLRIESHHGSMDGTAHPPERYCRRDRPTAQDSHTTGLWTGPSPTGALL